MRGTYRIYRPRVALGAEPSKPFNATPLIILGVCTALVIAVIKNERELGKG